MTQFRKEKWRLELHERASYIAAVRVSQGFWGTSGQRENIVGNKGT